MRFEIDRSKWLHGRMGEESMLLDDAGRMCCLGFCARALGISVDQILQIRTPSRSPSCGWPSELVEFQDDDDLRQDTRLTTVLININDEIELLDSEYMAETRAHKETRIAEKFATAGFEVAFVGEYRT